MLNIISKTRNVYNKLWGNITKEEIFDIIRYNSIGPFGRHRESQIAPEAKITANIGKIFIDKYDRSQKLYDDNLILFTLGSLFKLTEKGHEVMIKNYSCLSKYANGQEDTKQCMSSKQREEYIMKIVKKYFPERQNDVVIVDVEQEEGDKELFSLLKLKGITGLAQDARPELPENVTSLDIARYLYRVFQKNKKFRGRAMETVPVHKKDIFGNDKPKIQKTETNYPEYYGMLEIACRLNDILGGEQIQGGAERQYRYDGIIKTILGLEGNIRSMPELVPLQKFCQEKLNAKGKLYFDVFYVNEKIYKEYLGKKEYQKDKAKRIMRGSLRGIFAISGLFGLGKYTHDAIISTNKKINTYNERKVLADRLSRDGLDSIEVYRVIDSLETIGAERVYERIDEKYRTGGISEDTYKKRIVYEIGNNYNRLQKIGKEVPANLTEEDSMNYIIDKFLCEKFYPRRAQEVVLGGGDILPFQKIVEDNGSAIDFTFGFNQDVHYDRNLNSGGLSTPPIRSSSEGDDDILRNHGIDVNNLMFSFIDLGVREVMGKKYTIGKVGYTERRDAYVPKQELPISYEFFVASTSIKRNEIRKDFSTDLAKKVFSQILDNIKYAESYNHDPEKTYPEFNPLNVETDAHQSTSLGDVDTIHTEISK